VLDGAALAAFDKDRDQLEAILSHGSTAHVAQAR
jgi:hypothetical protein